MTLLEQIRQMPNWELEEFLVKLGCEGRECHPSCPGYDYCSRGHNGIRVMLHREAPQTDDVEVAESRCKEDKDVPLS